MSARRRLEELLRALRPYDRVLIIPHDNPDPDALATALGLHELVRHCQGKTARIARRGLIGRSENRAMVRALAIPLIPADTALHHFSGAIVLVDTQVGRNNNSLPPGSCPVAVIDHHPDWGQNQEVPFVDLHPEYGASTTIVVEYLATLGVPISGVLATALYYGIWSETKHLVREAQAADVEACEFLYPSVDKEILASIEMPRLERGYFELLSDAMKSTLRSEDLAITVLSHVPYPDAVAEIADLTVRERGVAWSICIARDADHLNVSLRSNQPDARAGLLLASILPSGMAGGHDMVAGGRTSIAGKDWIAEAHELVLAILRALGRRGLDVDWLVPRTKGAETVTAAAQRLLNRLPISSDATP